MKKLIIYKDRFGCFCDKHVELSELNDELLNLIKDNCKILEIE